MSTSLPHIHLLNLAKIDYDAIVQAHICRLETVAQDGALREAHDDLLIEKLLPGGVTIGQYTNAHHHRDGIFSSVLKAEGAPNVHRCSLLEAKSNLVALKVTHPSAMTPPHDSVRESRLLQKAECDRVVPLIEVFQQSGGRLILVFPYMPYDLEHLLRDGRINHLQRKSCVHDLMKGLEHIHSVGIIHRDIKPSNILLRTLSGPAYIADFGIAWADHDPASEPAIEKILDVGTTCYRAPELLFGNQKYDTSLDMWAAGCVAAQIVCLGSVTLFDSGDLGSDLALIKSIFQTLGTPKLEVWPEAKNFPDWGKMTFYEYPRKSWNQILPHTSAAAMELVSGMVRYESSERFSASSV